MEPVRPVRRMGDTSFIKMGTIAELIPTVIPFINLAKIITQTFEMMLIKSAPILTRSIIIISNRRDNF